MTAIRPTDSDLREKINQEEYTAVLNSINEKYSEMDSYISNLSSDITSIIDFENQMKKDKEKGYDVGTALDTLGFQKDSLTIDYEFFIHMKDVYIKKLYGDLYNYCDNIISDALSIEDIPNGFTVDSIRDRKFAGSKIYPAMITNPDAFDGDGNRIENTPEFIINNDFKYDMNDIFSLISVTVRNLRELAEDISSFNDKITAAKQRESRGFSVGNLIMNLESQKQKMTLQFDSYIIRLGNFLEQNKNFSGRCLNRIKIISAEIVTSEELENTEDVTTN